MSVSQYTNTEGLELPIEELLKEKEDLRLASLLGSVGVGTSWKLQPIAIIPKIEAYYSPCRFLSRRVVRGEEILPAVITTNYALLIESILGASREETLSNYPTLELETLGQLYSFKKKSEVTKFLESNAFLIGFLSEAYQQIQIYFGKSTEVVLEVITDLEVTRHQELGVFIRTELSVDEALEKLEQLDKAWWLDAPASIRRKICIDVEFK